MNNKKFTKEAIIACFPECVINRSRTVTYTEKYQDKYGNGRTESKTEYAVEVKGKVMIQELEAKVEEFIKSVSETKYTLAQQNYTLKYIARMANAYIDYARPNLNAVFYNASEFLRNTNEVNYSSDKVRNWYISLTTKSKARKGIYDGTGKVQLAVAMKEDDTVRGSMTIIRRISK